MSADENKEMVRRVLGEIWGRGNLDLVDEVLAEDFVRHGPNVEGGEVRGREGFKQLVRGFREVFPDLQTPTEAQVAEGDLVVTRWTARGTHRGPFLDVPPSGNQAAIPGVIVDRLAGGKIVEEWAYYDGLGMLQQLGATSLPGQAET
jgi:steroid delta-isomerase-like uncharacterized protein